jgi:hypothetical protein
VFRQKFRLSRVRGLCQAVGEPNMSMQRLMGYLALSAILTSPGCGTMANMDGRRLPLLSQSGQELSTPFGGVRRDIEWVKSVQAPSNLLYVADLPLSLVGDLVTLPKTVIGTHSDSLLQDPSSSQAASSFGTQVGPNPTITTE